jgi:Tol biopolymer transport system component
MNGRVQQTLEAMAERGSDPGASVVWERARAAAPRRRHRRRRIRTTLVAAAAILVVVVVAGTLEARSSAHHVVVSTPTTPATVTTGPSTSAAAVPSPDAIAFTRGLAIWSVEPSGNGLRRLTPAGCCSVSSWNPAHTELALDFNGQLTIMKPDGTRVNSFDATTIFPPAWSPDGKQIAFAASPAGGSNGGPIEVVDALGHDAPRVLGDVFAGAVSWSPDGTQIAYTALNEPLHIEVLTISTGRSRRLESGLAGEYYGPAWSRVSGRIAFASAGSIYDIRADGTDRRALVGCELVRCDSPSWTADGRSIAFERTAPTEAPQVYVDDLATRRVRPVTFGTTAAQVPSG